jgi:acyl transferase domain-containing protein
MLAVLGPWELLHSEPGLFRGLWLTGRNFDGNFVVAGPTQRVEQLSEQMHLRRISTQQLAVRQGFHTPLIDPVEDDCRSLVARMVPLVRPTRIPVISAASTEVVTRFHPDTLWDAWRQPVEFSATIAGLLKSGDYTFVDVGPSGSLATFVKYMLPNGTASRQYQCVNRFGRDLSNLMRLLSELIGPETAAEPAARSSQSRPAQSQ